MRNKFYRYKLSKIYLFFVILFIHCHFIFSQSISNTTQTPNGFRYVAEILYGDTIPVVNLNTVTIYGDYIFKMPRQREAIARFRNAPSPPERLSREPLPEHQREGSAHAT